MKKYAIIERIGIHYTVICDFVAANGQRFHDEIVFNGRLDECHAYAAEHRMVLKTRECWENMLRKSSVSLNDKAVVIVC